MENLPNRAQSESLYLRWFLDDVFHAIAYGPALEASWVSSQGSQEDEERMIAEGLSSDLHATDLESEIQEFLARTACKLIEVGRADYEVVFKPESEDQGRRFLLMPLSKRGLIRTNWGFLQRIPEVVREKVGGRHWRWAPRRAVVSFRMDGSAGIAAARTRRALSRLQLFPRNGADESIDVARASRHVGWRARGMFDQEVSEFYQIWRELDFARWTARVREALLMQLGAALGHIANEQAFRGRLEARWPMTAAMLDDTVSEFLAGRLGPKKALETIRRG